MRYVREASKHDIEVSDIDSFGKETDKSEIR